MKDWRGVDITPGCMVVWTDSQNKPVVGTVTKLNEYTAQVAVVDFVGVRSMPKCAVLYGKLTVVELPDVEEDDELFCRKV